MIEHRWKAAPDLLMRSPYGRRRYREHREFHDQARSRWSRVSCAVAWRRWWVKVLAFIALMIALAYAALLIFVLPGLPSVDALKTYEPPLPSNVRDTNGMPVYSYARERRVQLSFDEYPKMLVAAYLSAEDKTFFSHHGVDYLGVVSALWDNTPSAGSGRAAHRRSRNRSPRICWSATRSVTRASSRKRCWRIASKMR